MAKLKFDEKEHKYSVGRKGYVSVTTILKETRLTDFSKIPEKDRIYYMNRGTQNHKLWEMVELGTADQYEFDSVVEQYRAAHAKFLSDTGFKAFPDGIEKIVSNDTYRIAGKLDRFGIMNGRHVVIDYKTSSIYPETAIQTALYAICLDIPFFEIDRYGVAFKNDGKYKLEKFPDRKDRDVAIAAITLYHWKKQNGKTEKK